MRIIKGQKCVKVRWIGLDGPSSTQFIPVSAIEDISIELPECYVAIEPLILEGEETLQDGEEMDDEKETLDESNSWEPNDMDGQVPDFTGNGDMDNDQVNEEVKPVGFDCSYARSILQETEDDGVSTQQNGKEEDSEVEEEGVEGEEEGEEDAEAENTNEQELHTQEFHKPQINKYLYLT